MTLPYRIDLPSGDSAILALEHASPESTVFVDDRAESVCAAAALGIDTIHFIDATGVTPFGKGRSLASRYRLSAQP
jgi:FMN phosphatase YigB (HAD superfamily)